jgi:site-specific recombinase XerD
MDEDLVLHPQVLCWLRQSILASHIATYTAHLRRHRYTGRTLHGYLYSVAHFAHWLSSEDISLATLGDETIRRFLSIHLPDCRCSYPVRRSVHESRAALRRLLEALRANHVIAEHQPAVDSISMDLDLFDRYMGHVRGLAVSTRRQRVLILRRFLSTCSRSGAVDFARIRPAHIRRFVLSARSKHSPGTIGVLGGALRSYLRFHALEGDEVRHLLDAVPSAANWRLAAIPEVFSRKEVQTLLNSLQKKTPADRRSYAIVRCLTDLGLRACEVARLDLDDINWQAGTIHLPTGKPRRGDILPLPYEVGRAIADYVRRDRPRSANRAVFVRHVAPFDKPIGAGVVRRAVRDAYQRCGWSHTRVHTLRHSMASMLLESGAPLKEIADLLRHRSLDTSMIYTKVDIRTLRSVALPWIGRRP